MQKIIDLNFFDIPLKSGMLLGFCVSVFMGEQKTFVQTSLDKIVKNNRVMFLYFVEVL